MKTLVVLSALVAVTIAAPALLEDGHETRTPHLTETFKRDAKPLLDTTTTQEATALQPSPLHARSLILKKPIIVKKKEGYHVYRDSDEEQADSRETCVKQVKVKLCDDQSMKGDMARAVIEDPSFLMSEDDMKHSIKLAKEAVENLQRDLKKAENKHGERTLQHDHSETDIELHHDIEVARQALEHIHQNFGNLEAMSLHTSELNDAEKKENNQFAIAETEEGRLAQWKEAIDNKNFEVARNIEDSFKLEDLSQVFEDAETADAEIEMKNAKEMHMKAKEDKIKEDEITPKAKSNIMENKNTNLEDDMITSPTVALETKALADHENKLLLKNAEQLNLEHEELDVTPKAVKEAEMETSASNQTPKFKVAEDMLDKERKTEIESEQEQIAKHKDLALFEDKAKSVEHKDLSLKQLKNVENDKRIEELSSEVKNAEEDLTKLKSAEKAITTELKNENAKEVDTSLFVKSAEQIAQAKENNFADNHKEHAEKTEKKFEGKMSEGESMMMPSFSPESLNLDDKERDSNKKNSAHVPVEHHHEGMHREHDDRSLFRGEHHDMVQHENAHQHLEHPHHHHSKMANMDQQANFDQMRWNNENQMHMASMKAAEEFSTQGDALMKHQAAHQHHMDHMRQHHSSNPHIHPHPHHARFNDNFMAQGKSADIESMQPAYYMRESMDGQERFRWMPAQESTRSAYGAPAPAAAPNTGAVGLFPNANVGGCGIPLLLSCNPSVVSGSLAKPHSYSAPAYRSEDEFSFHAKRDIKASEKLNNKVNRNPTLTKTKISTLSIKQ